MRTILFTMLLLMSAVSDAQFNGCGPGFCNQETIVTPVPPLDGVSGLTLAVSMSRKLVTAYGGAFYADTAGAIDTWNDQSGAANNLIALIGSRPTVTTGGLNNIMAAGFDGINDYIHTDNTLAISSLFSNSSGWIIACVLVNSISENAANIYDNNPVFGDSDAYMGLYLKDIGTPKSASSYNYDGSVDVAASATISLATAYVFEWIHDGGNLSLIINNGTPTTVASGNTAVMTGVLGFGHGYTGSLAYLDGLIFEAAVANAVPANRSAIADNFKTQCGAWLMERDLNPANDNWPVGLVRIA